MAQRLVKLTCVCVSITILLCGCAAPLSFAELNLQHKTATFKDRDIWERGWAVNRGDLVSTRAIVIYAYGGDDSSQPRKERMRADFESVFVQNSLALMRSIFGTTRGDLTAEQAEYLLDVQVRDVHSKSAMLTIQKSVFEIEIRFRIIERGESSETIAAETVAKGKCISSSGTAFSFHSHAHKRANDAINAAFLDGQEKLYIQMSERLNKQRELILKE